MRHRSRHGAATRVLCVFTLAAFFPAGVDARHFASAPGQAPSEAAAYWAMTEEELAEPLALPSPVSDERSLLPDPQGLLASLALRDDARGKASPWGPFAEWVSSFPEGGAFVPVRKVVEQAYSLGEAEAAERAAEACWAFLEAHPGDYAAVAVARAFWAMLWAKGEQAEAEGMPRLREYGEACAFGPARLGAWFAWGCYSETPHRNNQEEALLAWANVRRDADALYLQAPNWAKGMFGLCGGRALSGLDRYAQAAAWYERCSQEGVGGAYLDWMGVLAEIRAKGMGASQEVGAVADFLRAHPGSALTDHALAELGAWYVLEGDYAGGAAVYEEAARRGHPLWAPAVLGELDFLAEHLDATVPAGEERVGIPGGCGPEALRVLLKERGIECSAAELSAHAGTDSSGTTFLGLITAARQAGVSLSGVHANRPEDLPLPAIAYVGKDHFVVVRGVSEEGIRVVDPAASGRTLSRADFAAWWDGQALVLDRTGLAPMSLAALAGQKGGRTPYADYGGGGGGAGIRSNEPAWRMHGPNLPTRVTSPGVHLEVNAFESCVDLRETDLLLDVRGSLALQWGRTYLNERGFERTGGDACLGAGWVSTLSVRLRPGPVATPGDPWGGVQDVIFVDSAGTARAYSFARSDGVYDYFTRETGQTSERGIVIRRAVSAYPEARLWYVDFPDGMTYGLSAASPEGNGTARLEYIQDAGGTNTVRLSYAHGKLVRVEGPAGDARRLEFTYDQAGRVVTAALIEREDLLQTVAYSYDASGRLAEVTQADGETVRYRYGSQGRGSSYIETITDKAGAPVVLNWRFALEGDGEWSARHIGVTTPDGTEQCFSRAPGSHVAVMTVFSNAQFLEKRVLTPLGRDLTRVRFDDHYQDEAIFDRRAYGYDGQGDLVRVNGPDGRIETEYAYTSRGRLAQVVRSGGEKAVYRYARDESLAPYAVRDAAGLETPLYFDAFGRLWKAVPPDTAGQGYEMSYDAFGQVKAMRAPDGSRSWSEHDPTGRVTCQVDAVGRETVYGYDRLGNLVEGPEGERYAYTAPDCATCGMAGRVCEIRSGQDLVAAFEYDQNGNTTLVKNALGEAGAYVYDAMNRLVSEAFPAGNGAGAWIDYAEGGRAVTQTDADGHWRRLEYDCRGNLTGEWDEEGLCAAYAYDERGALASVADGLGHLRRYVYDDAGRLCKVADADGRVVRYFCDAAGRLCAIGAGASGTLDPIALGYDSETGQLASIRYGRGPDAREVRVEYDPLGRIVRMRDWMDADGGMRYAYDAAGAHHQN